MKRAAAAGLYILFALVSWSTALAQERPPSESVEQYEQWVKDTYIPDRKTKYDEKEQEVKDLVQSMSENEGGGGEKFINFHGAEEGDFVRIQEEDMQKSILDGTFEEANDYLLEYLIQTTAWEPSSDILILPPPLSFTRDGCEFRSQLPPGLAGYGDWGTCVNAVIIDPFNPFCLYKYYFTSSLVEYYYPGYKADSSEEMYQSYYYLKDFIDPAVMEANEQILYEQGADNAADTITFISQITAQEGSARGFEFGQAEAQPDRNAIDQLKQLDRDLRHTAPHLAKSYGRLVMDPVNFASLQMPWVPHVEKSPLYGADLPESFSGTGEPVIPGLFGGIHFSRFLFNSIFWVDRWTNFMMPMFGPRHCMASNKSTGKTPKDLVSFADPPEMEDDIGSCLKDIGEVFPLYDDRRPHITDGTYQAVWRAMEIYRGLFPEGGSSLGSNVDDETADGDAWGATRHTFKRSIDKWQVLGNEDLEAETDRLVPFDDLYKLNVTYDKSNVKHIRSGGENRFLVWPVFKGCWGVNTFSGEWEKGLRPGIEPAVPLNPPFVAPLQFIRSDLPLDEIRLY